MKHFIKCLSLFLYSYFNQELLILLQNENNKLTHINSYIEDSDNIPINEISRHLRSNFKGLFSQDIYGAYSLPTQLW